MEGDKDEEYTPDLQLEFAGQGPGSGGRTAIGAHYFGDGPEIDRTGLKNPPWWFRFYAPFILETYRAYFSKKGYSKSFRILEEANVPPMYRLGLGVKWLFRNEDGEFILTEEEFAPIVEPSDNLDLPLNYRINLKHILNAIELRTLYQLWRSHKPNLLELYSPSSITS
jgi:hypothetical protein